jgi:hypothetical protein
MSKSLYVVAALFLVGWANFFAQSEVVETIYVVGSMTFLGAVLLGGILSEYSQETIDFKEIYREKDRLQKDKIIQLELQLAENEQLSYTRRAQR